MAENSGRRRFFGTGIISVLMVFLVLCFTTFGVLSLVSAQADMRLSERNADNVTDFYNADRIAKTVLSSLEKQRAAGYLAGISELKVNHGGLEISCLFNDDGNAVAFTLPVGEYVELSVGAEYDTDSGRYVISRYRTVALEPTQYQSSGQQLFSFESEAQTQ